ncbi:hypothetical protein PENSPDRAFT_758381 [Peniophora sp. CONT]|nr:hypothetical protein PENSPDRAFT_758381 [Peniophora sp. CONT]
MASSDADTAYNLSEVESIDSDWLDLSSRASEDNESLGDLESDRENPSRPLSRQSSISGSSIGEPDGWEGLAENTDDEALLSGVESDAPPPVADDFGTVRARGVAAHRHVEEMRERQALEQSMVSTLNSSRGGSLAASATSSSPLSGSARSRDLRLSFPDPLTSPRNELNRSYDNVILDDALPGSPPQEPEREVEAPVVTTPAPVVAVRAPVRPVNHRDSLLGDLQLVLYGDSRGDKHIITQELLGKLAEGLNLSIGGPTAVDGVARYTLLKRGKVASSTVHVIDNTNVFDPPNSDARPSLAVVFLPALLKTLPRHSLYLPITQTLPAEIDTIATDSLRADAERQWTSLQVPDSQLLLWHVDTPSPALSAAEVSALDPAEVVLGFEPLLPRRHRALQALRDQTASAPAVTLITLLSIILGYIVGTSFTFNTSTASKSAITSVAEFIANTSYPSAVPSPSPILFNGSRALASAPLSSLSTMAPLRNSLAAVPVSLTPTSASTKSLKSSIPLNPTTTCIVPGSCVASTSSLAITTQTPTGALAAVPSIAKSLMAVPSPGERALSARCAHGLSELLKPHGKGKAAAGGELINALDELQHAISGQASTLLSSLSSLSSLQSGAQTVQERLRARNDRAHDRARGMRKRGEQALREAHGRAWGRVELARQRAREIHSRIEEEAASIVDSVQRRWEERVQERETRRAERAERETRRAERAERRRVHDWVH